MMARSQVTKAGWHHLLCSPLSRSKPEDFWLPTLPNTMAHMKGPPSHIETSHELM
ncbi:hypothetical protein COCNU_03G001120 [Cocos nucifera]|uniref:Uncharacterized protein n=1 Tax=Cocos nucifera TaxID=13894 RepID=A0A8K0I1H5_COCNU|nr:hypothetical protein COCNU_03G001120 [Cocos nucifera]